LLRLSLRGLGQYFKEHHDRFADFIAAKDGMSRTDADRRLDNMVAVLALFDRLELAQRSGPERAIWILSVRTSQPWQK
jgi:hypothetical protein